MGKGGGDSKFQCNCCSKVFVGSYTSVMAYLFKIKNVGIRMFRKVTQSDIVEFVQVKKEAEIHEQSAQPKDVPYHPL